MQGKRGCLVVKNARCKPEAWEEAKKEEQSDMIDTWFGYADSVRLIHRKELQTKRRHVQLERRRKEKEVDGHHQAPKFIGKRPSDNVISVACCCLTSYFDVCRPEAVTATGDGVLQSSEAGDEASDELAEANGGAGGEDMWVGCERQGRRNWGEQGGEGSVEAAELV